MEPQQLLGVFERKGRHAVVPSLPVDFDGQYEQAVPANPRASPAPVRANLETLRSLFSDEQRREQRRDAAAVAAGEITYLDHTIDVESESGGPAWTAPELFEPPALWRLKFRGFEFLRPMMLGFDGPADCPDHHATICDWLYDWADDEVTRIGRKRYLRELWTPHAVSLRLLNWCRYFAWCANEERGSAFSLLLRRAIYKNALFLSNHVEYDIGGNHLIENGTALVMAGLLFESEQQSWLETGLTVLKDARDQFLEDGGHYERSPMYHLLTLVRYLTVVDLLRAADRSCPDAILETATAATGFLNAMRPPDGTLPLLNDSVFGQGLPVDVCLDYATSVGIDPGPDVDSSRALAASGYYWLGDGPNQLLVDGGPIGPAHLPAHSHNDLLSIQLWAAGVHVFTDTGTFDYTPTDRRQYARSVRAHNTVQFGDTEPIDIGGRYLAGRRLQPDVDFATVEGMSVFDGQYQKETLGGPTYSHRRRITADEDWWLVGDQISAPEPQVVRSRLHCHPDVTIESESNDAPLTLTVDDDPIVYLYPIGTDDVTRSTSPYFPRFGTEQERPVLTLRATDLNQPFGFLLSRTRYDSVKVARDAERSTALSLDGVHYDLPTVTDNKRGFQ